VSRNTAAQALAVFTAIGPVNHEDFGSAWTVALEIGGVRASRDVDLDFEVETVGKP
jgi:hypothetical protein